MEQKDYKLSIILALLNNEGHIRGIAKKLNTNHMQMVRKLKELEKANVVDYKEEGRNKTYFLKKTVEAKNYCFAAENYKLIQTLNKYPQLRNIIEKIQKNKEIRLAVLFGSYAKGIPSEGSDIDIYVDSQNNKIKKQLQMVDTKLSIKLGAFDTSNLLIQEIEKNHVIIKGIEAYYEKNKFFD